jgi:hypothetical protein
MNHKLSILLLTCAFLSFVSSAQSELCDTIHEYPEIQASFGKEKREVFDFFYDNILEIIYDPDSGEYPPTSFKMKLIVNDQDEVVSISKIHGDYSEAVKQQILEVLQKEEWKSGTVNGEKVCSTFYFVIGCILWE